MAVRRKKDGNYIADVFMGYKKNGKPWRKTKTCGTEDEAKYWDHKFNLQKAAKTGDAPDETTFSEYLEHFYWPKKKNLASLTKETRKRVLNRYVVPLLGDKPINQITRDDVQRVIDLCPTNYTGKKARQELSAVLSFAFDGTSRINPASSRHFTYSKARGKSRKGDILTTYAEHKKLLNYVRENMPGSPTERIIVLGLCLGLRPEEALALDWENIDFEKKTAFIEQTLQDEGGKHLQAVKTPKSLRHVPLNKYAAKRLEAWHDEDEAPYDATGNEIKNIKGEPARPILRNSLGRRMSHRAACKLIQKLRESNYDDGTCLPQITQWSLRHSFGTAAVIDKHMDANLLQLIMGHADVSTTRRLYVKPAFSDVVDAMRLLDDCYDET